LEGMRFHPLEVSGSGGRTVVPRREPGLTRVRPLALTLTVLGLLLFSCGQKNDFSEDMARSQCPECATAPWLTEENHGDYGEGWGHASCFVCHPLIKLHVQTWNPYLDLELIRAIVKRDGLDSCATCHGNNGI